ncbi:MAG TPA: cupin domain-containing protein [Candidatus Polarisedimenticolia bacterium]|jgi:quercetin dioxygenase-like cupin family protein
MLSCQVESFIRFDETKPAVHAIADSGHARLMLVCLKAGQILKDHRSGSQVIAHFLSGRGTFYADGVPQEAGAGTIVLIEPGRFHRIEAIEECVVLVTMAPHPAREGYPRDQLDRIIPRAGSPA